MYILLAGSLLAVATSSSLTRNESKYLLDFYPILSNLQTVPLWFVDEDIATKSEVTGTYKLLPELYDSQHEWIREQCPTHTLMASWRKLFLHEHTHFYYLHLFQGIDEQQMLWTISSLSQRGVKRMIYRTFTSPHHLPFPERNFGFPMLSCYEEINGGTVSAFCALESKLDDVSKKYHSMITSKNDSDAQIRHLIEENMNQRDQIRELQASLLEAIIDKQALH